MSIKATNRDRILIYHPPELHFKGREVNTFIFLCSRLNPLIVVPHILSCLLSLLFFPLRSLWCTEGAPNLTWFYPNPLVKTQRIAQSLETLMLGDEITVQTVDMINSQKSWNGKPLESLKHTALASHLMASSCLTSMKTTTPVPGVVLLLLTQKGRKFPFSTRYPRMIDSQSVEFLSWNRF